MNSYDKVQIFLFFFLKKNVDLRGFFFAYGRNAHLCTIKMTLAQMNSLFGTKALAQ